MKEPFNGKHQLWLVVGFSSPSNGDVGLCFLNVGWVGVLDEPMTSINVVNKFSIGLVFNASSHGFKCWFSLVASRCQLPACNTSLLNDRWTFPGHPTSSNSYSWSQISNGSVKHLAAWDKRCLD